MNIYLNGCEFMELKSLMVENFKSFEKISIDLNDLNIFIGSNSSGKSNFVQIFKFLQDLNKHNLDIAISKQGGVDYLRNINIANSKPLKIKLSSNNSEMFPISNKKNENMIGIVYKTNYSFSINFKDRDEPYDILQDELELHVIFIDMDSFSESSHSDELNNILKTLKTYDMNKNETKISNTEILGNNIIKVSNKSGKLSLEFENENLAKEDLFPKAILEYAESDLKRESSSLLIETVISKIPISWGEHITDISFYDFDPKSCKTAAKLTDNIPLKENGENLSIILEHILKNEKKKKKFFNLLNDLLPSIKNMDIKDFVDNSRIFELRESYSKENYIPASLVSDGSSNIIALIVALYFQRGDLIFIEEPERNIHPKLLSKVVEMMKDSSKHHQIFTTTHNPEMLKYINPENIYFISRDNNGYSTITKPLEEEDLKPLIEEIGIEELFIDDILGV